MRIKLNLTRLLASVGMVLPINFAHAGIPVWTFTPLTVTNVVVPTNGSSIIQYRITNQATRTHTLKMKPVVGASQDSSGVEYCAPLFTLAPQQSCILSINVDGSKLPAGGVRGGPIVCNQGNPNQCYRPGRPDEMVLQSTGAPGQAVLEFSISNMALSVTGLTEQGVVGTPSSGHQRTLAIRNTGTITATDVTYNLSRNLPIGSTISPSSCGNILPKSACVLTITPGATPSAAVGDTSATPIVLTAASSNGSTARANLSILTYGSVYQSGYVFAFDDSTPTTQSVGGKVAALEDAQGSPIVWDSSSGCNDTDQSCIVTGALSNSNGANVATPMPGDTYIIVSTFSNLVPPLATSTYAAGLCMGFIDGYSDWYLPAICEMGYRTADGSGSTCGETPGILQNMQYSLFDYSNLSLMYGAYWSSTEYSVSPQYRGAFDQFFSMNGQYQDLGNKNAAYGVRCVRAIT